MNTDTEPSNPSPITELPDGSGCFTATVMSEEEAMALPIEKRPLNYRISSELYHAVFESIGAASMAWEPRPGKEVFNANEASKIAVDLCFKIAKEMESKGIHQTSPCAMRDQRLSLDELAHRELVPALWTDKRSRREGDGEYILHDYLRRYEREWGKWRDEPIRLLEIGLNVGASIKLWLEYFSKSQVVGMDIVDFKFAPEIEKFIVEQIGLHRFDFVKADAFSPQDLQKFAESQDDFDIIVDDGAHFSGPIIMAFQYLWPKVKSGGYYAIEDLTEVKNPASHTPGYPDQIQFSEALLGRIIMGERNDIDEAFVSKDLIILKKK